MSASLPQNGVPKGGLGSARGVPRGASFSVTSTKNPAAIIRSPSGIPRKMLSVASSSSFNYKGDTSEDTPTSQRPMLSGPFTTSGSPDSMASAGDSVGFSRGLSSAGSVSNFDISGAHRGSLSSKPSFMMQTGSSSAKSVTTEVPLARKQALAAISANKAASKPSNVVVGVRSRPLNSMERAMGDEDAWAYEGQLLYEKREGPGGPHAREHTYDFVYPPDTKTADVYDSMGVPIVEAALEGYNGTLFAYGQTGSGKTYTLMGTAEEPGMTILAIHDIFKRIEDATDTEFLVRVSYVELYQEEIRDLFNPEAGTLKIVDNPISGPYVKGLTEEVVLSPERVLELMAIGETNRHVAATNMNLRSSRSHTLFKMVIESRKTESSPGDAPPPTTPALHPTASKGPGMLRSQSFSTSNASAMPVPGATLLPTAGSVVRVATLHLIDLAGSERVSKTGAAVINKLISGEQHIPYRDSKLTRLLSTSLGGNAKTAVVVAISPCSWNIGETRSSLQFAARAMKVVNKARVNEVADESALLAQYQKEVSQLKAALLEGRGGMIITADGEVVSAEEMLARMKRQHDERQREMEEQLKSQLDSTAEASLQITDLVQLCFVAAHACGHIRSSAFIIEQLAEVAAGKQVASQAIRLIVSLVPGFKKRMTRLLKSQHIRAMSGSTLASDIMDAASPNDRSPSPSSRYSQSSDVAKQKGSAGKDKSLSPNATAKASLATSSLDWSVAGTAASTVRLHSVAEEHGEESSDEHDPNDQHEGSALRFAASGHSLHDGEHTDLVELDHSAAEDAFAVEAASAISSAYSNVSNFGEEYAIDYFSPQSFSRQLKALFATKETLSRRVKDQAEALAAKVEEANQCAVEAKMATDALQHLEIAYKDLQQKATAAADQSAADFLAIRGNQELITALRARIQELEDSTACLQREASAGAVASSGKEMQLNGQISQLERQLDDETKRRENTEAAMQAADRRSKDLEHAKLMMERELASVRSQLEVERSRNEDLLADVRRMKADCEGASSRLSPLQNELDAANSTCASLRAALSDLEQHMSTSRSRIAELDGALAEAGISRDDAVGELAITKVQLNEQSARTSELEEELSKARLQNEEKSTIIASLQMNAKSLDSNIEQLKKELSAAVVTSRRFEKDFIATSAQVQALNERNEFLTGELNKSGSDSHSWQSRCLELDSRLKEAEAAIYSSTSAYAELEHAMQTKDIQHKLTLDNLQSKELLVDQLSADLRDVRNKLSAATVDKDDRSRRVVQLEAELRMLQAAHTTATAEHTKEMEELQSKIRSLEATALESDAQIASLTEECGSWKRSHAAAQQTLDVTQKELKDVSQRLKVINQECAQESVAQRALTERLQASISSLTLARNHLEESCSEQAAQITLMTSQLSQKDEEISALKVGAIELETQRKEAVSHSQQLLQQIALLEAEAKRSESRVTSMHMQLSELSRKGDAETNRANAAEARANALDGRAIRAEAAVNELTARSQQLSQAYSVSCSDLQRLSTTAEMLQTDNAKLLQEVANLTERDRSNTVEVETLTEQLESARQLTSKLDSFNQTSEIERRKLLEQVKELSDSNAGLKAKVDWLDIRLSKTISEKSSLQQYSESLQGTISTLLTEKETLVAQVAANSSASTIISKALADAKGEIESFTNTVFAQRNEIGKLTEMLAQARASLQSSKARCVELETSLTDARETAERNASERDVFVARLAEAEKAKLACTVMISDANTQLEESQGSIAALRSSREQLSAELRQLSSKYLDISAREDLLTKQVLELQQALEKAEQATRAERDTNTTVSASCSALKADVENLSQTIDSLRKVNVQLGTDLDRRDSQLRVLQDECSSLRSRLADGDARIAAIMESSTATKRTAEAAEHSASDWQKRYSALSNDLDEYRAKCSNAEAVIREQTALVATLQSKANAEEERANKLSTTVETYKADLEQLSGQVRSLSVSSNTLSQRNADLDTKCSALGTALAAANSEVDNMRNLVRKLQTDIIDNVAIREQLESEKISVVAELHEVKDRCSKGAHTIEELEQKLAQERSEAAAILKEREMLKQKLNLQTSSLTSMQQLLDESSSTLTQLRKQLSLRDEHITETRAALTTRHGELQSVQSALSGKGEELTQAEKIITTLREQLQQRSDSEVKLKDVLAAESKAKDSLTRQMSEFTHELELLRTSVTIEHQRNVELSSTISNLEASLTACNREKESLITETTNLRGLTGDLRVKLADLETMNALAGRSVAALRMELQTQIEETNALKDNVLQLHRNIAKLEDERATAVADANYSTTELESTRVRLVAAQRENAQLRQDATRLREETVTTRQEASKTVRAAMQFGINSVREDVRSVKESATARSGIGNVGYSTARRGSVADDLATVLSGFEATRLHVSPTGTVASRRDYDGMGGGLTFSSALGSSNSPQLGLFAGSTVSDRKPTIQLDLHAYLPRKDSIHSTPKY